MYKCKNCGWEGEEPVRNVELRLDNKCPVCGDETVSCGVKVEKSESNIIDSRVKDFVDDLKDDGKRNYSNDPGKKSPGRHKKKRGKR
jgi:transcription elongation factor Elf1